MISPLRFTTKKSKFNRNNDVVAIFFVFVCCLAVFLSNEVVVCFSTSRSSKNNKAPITATSTTTTFARLFSTPSPSYYSDQRQHASSLSQGESLVLGVGSFSTGSFTAQQQPLWMGKSTHKNTQAATATATATATISKASAAADGSSAIVSSGSHDRFTAPSLKRGNY